MNKPPRVRQLRQDLPRGSSVLEKEDDEDAPEYTTSRDPKPVWPKMPRCHFWVRIEKKMLGNEEGPLV